MQLISNVRADQDIQSKFLANATLWLDEEHAESALEAIMCPESRPVRSVMHTLRTGAPE